MASVMPAEFEQWASQHTSLFRFVKQEDRAMVRMWLPIFVSHGYTLAELIYATEVMTRNPPKYPSDHLKCIRGIIGAFRKKLSDEEQSAWDAIDQFETCKDCQNTGWASVPHLRFVSSGSWDCYPGAFYKPTQVVTCSCKMGRRIDATHIGKPRPMALEQYEERNPDWRHQASIYKEAVVAEGNVARLAASRNYSPSQMVEELAAHMAARATESECSNDSMEAAKRSHQDRRTQLSLYESHAEPSGRDDRVTEGLRL